MTVHYRPLEIVQQLYSKKWRNKAQMGLQRAPRGTKAKMRNGIQIATNS